MSGEELRSLRGALGLSQQEMARALDVSFASVNRWETENPRTRRDIPEEKAALLEALSALVEGVSGAGARPSLEDIAEAVRTEGVGVAGVVSKAALAKELPEPTLLATLRRVPPLRWIAGVLGLGVLGSLPFFALPGIMVALRERKDKIKVKGRGRETSGGGG